MILYNVSFNLHNTRNRMLPAIPSSTADDEDRTTQRICLTDSVEHCMQAIAVGNRKVEIGAHFILRVVDISKNDTNLIIPILLKQSNKVPDALENSEYWYLKPKKAKVYLCEIQDFSYERGIAWTCITPEQCRNTIYKHFTGIKLERFKSSEVIFNNFVRYTNKHHLWDLQDEVWEDMIELPWAQKTTIYNMKYKIIKDFQK